MELKDSQTAINLMTAFAGESQARNRYNYAASVAKKEGFVQIAAIFEETANQEKEHAKRLFKYMDGEEVTVNASFPFGTIGDTVSNLIAAAAGEDHETTTMYPEFAETADKEGFAKIAATFRAIAVAEARHRDRYLALKKNIEEGKVFRKDTKSRWICRNCGYVHEGLEAPKVCAACLHAQAHFELESFNY